MAFYEVIATASITLALAIPAFLEKVMRSGYERRVESYKDGVIHEFRDVFIEAFNEFNEAQALTQDIEEKISEVVGMWEDVRTNYHKLEELIKTRIYLTIGWIAVFASSIGAIYSENFDIILFNIDWAGITNVVFIVLLLATVIYFYQLLKFDYDLTKYTEKKFEEKLVLSEEKKDIKDRIESFRDYIKEKELIIENLLKRQNIKFEKEVTINSSRFDFAIPNSKSPQIIIETKFTRREGSLPHFIYGSVIGQFALLKKEFPEIKTILITNFDLSKYSARYKDLLKFTDSVIDIAQIDQLNEFIKKHLNK